MTWIGPDNTSDFDSLRSRQGQAEAILVAYDIMEVDGQGVRPEPLEERRKRLAKLLSRKTTMRDGIQISEAITGDGAAVVTRAGWTSKALCRSARLTLRERTDAGRLRTKNPNFERR